MSLGSQMIWAGVLHRAVWVQASGKVGPGQEEAQRGALLRHLYPEPDPLALIPHDLVKALDLSYWELSQAPVSASSH